MVTKGNGLGTLGMVAVAGGITGAALNHYLRRQSSTPCAPHEQERQRAAWAHQQRMHCDLLMKAIDDPTLAPVIDTYDKSIPAEKRRQFLYANLWYVNAYHLYMAGIVNLKGLHGHLRELFQSPIMRQYWEASRAQRATLDQDSAEVRVGHVVDQLIKDLDAADTDEWWVVGEPPME